jgi:hypothetical protein
VGERGERGREEGRGEAIKRDRYIERWFKQRERG